MHISDCIRSFRAAATGRGVDPPDRPDAGRQRSLTDPVSGITTAINQEIALTKQDDQILDWDEGAHDKVKRSSRDLFRLLAARWRKSAMTHASFSEEANARQAKSQMGFSDTILPIRDFHLRGLAPLTLFVTWYQRACFRAELLADLRHKAEYLKDIGICRHEATSEVARFFWEPVLLRRNLSNPLP
ncbi:uncharacterized protein YjiS (DUF1127 family) [Bradyrhizobium sp. i1.3.1]